MANQTIKCQVESCKYNSPDHYCELRSINVAPAETYDSDSVSSKRDSMCASFEEKKRGWF